MRRTFTTNEVALWLRINPRSVHRWCRARGVHPLRTMRIGRSTVTVWSIADLTAATRPKRSVLATEREAC